MIRGSRNFDYSPRDIEYLRDLGPISPDGPIAMANPIYTEVIPRELTVAQESELEASVCPHSYVRSDGTLDLPKLLSKFQAVFRENSEHGSTAGGIARPARSSSSSPTSTAWSTAAAASLASTPSAAGVPTSSSNGHGPVGLWLPVP